MRRIDAAVISVIERLAGRVQIWTSYDCIVQSRWLSGAIALLVLGDMASSHEIKALSALAVTLNTWRLFFEIDEDRAIRVDCLRGLSNRRKVGLFDMFHRYMALGAAVVVFIIDALMLTFEGRIGGVVWDVVICCALPAIYLNACDPLPPCSGKWREMFRVRRLATEAPRAD